MGSWRGGGEDTVGAAHRRAERTALENTDRFDSLVE